MSNNSLRKIQRRRHLAGCEHIDVAWTPKFKHDHAGAVDVRVGGCRNCGKQVRQRMVCRAMLRVGDCQASLADGGLPSNDRLAAHRRSIPMQFEQVSYRPSWFAVGHALGLAAAWVLRIFRWRRR